MYVHTAGPSTACHHARPAGETQAVQRDGQSPPQTHHEGEGAQETRWAVTACVWLTVTAEEVHVWHQLPVSSHLTCCLLTGAQMIEVVDQLLENPLSLV